jgi:enoyl-[acyl-carrier protein] reductase I
MLHFSEQVAPLRRNITAEDVGNTALWLCSDLGSAITGETIFVDAGINVMGLSLEMLPKKPSSEASAD